MTSNIFYSIMACVFVMVTMAAKAEAAETYYTDMQAHHEAEKHKYGRVINDLPDIDKYAVREYFDYDEREPCQKYQWAPADFDRIGCDIHLKPKRTIRPRMAARLLSFENDVSAFEIYFHLDRSAVSEREKMEVERAVNHIMNHDIAMVNVEGHADRVGDDPYNNRLSKKRADKVIAYLKSRGIPHEMITPSAYGEQFPRIATPDGMDLRQNRRVLITWQ